MANKVNDISRESWILNTFPEWGTWLNEEIEREDVKPGTFSMWWLGCTGIWLKTENRTNLVTDLWCSTGKKTHGNGLMKQGHQHMKMIGCQKIQPNLRNVPCVIDPFAMKDVDALLARGELAPITQWLGSHVHRYGKLYPPAVLLERATGEAFQPLYYVEHLQSVLKGC